MWSQKSPRTTSSFFTQDSSNQRPGLGIKQQRQDWHHLGWLNDQGSADRHLFQSHLVQPRRTAAPQTDSGSSSATVRGVATTTTAPEEFLGEEILDQLDQVGKDLGEARAWYDHPQSIDGW